MSAWIRVHAFRAGLPLIVFLMALSGCRHESGSVAASETLAPFLPDPDVPAGALPISGYLSAADSTHHFDTDVYVPDGERLIIEPGSRLLFGAGKGLYVLGSLEGIGAPQDTIFFGSESNWLGISVLGSLASISLIKCRIEGATEGIRIEDGVGVIRESSIQQCLSPLVSAKGGARVFLSDSRIVGTGEALVLASGTATLQIERNTFDLLQFGTAVVSASGGDIRVEGNVFRGHGDAVEAIYIASPPGTQNGTQAFIHGNSFLDLNPSQGWFVVYAASVTRLILEANRFRGNGGGHIRADGVASVRMVSNEIEHDMVEGATVELNQCESVLADNHWVSILPSGRPSGGISVGGGTARIEGSTWDGLRGLIDNSGQMTVVRCLFRNSPNIADSLTTYDNCLFADCGQTAAAVTASGGSLFRNCVFLDNLSDLTVVAPGTVTLSGCILDNGDDRVNIWGGSGSGSGRLRILNTFVDSGLGAIDLPVVFQVEDTGLLTGDPGFDLQGPKLPLGEFPYTLTLLPNSICRDSGPPESERNDLDGSRNDMGIYGGPEDIRILEATP
jgi:hypothetical protein